MPLRDWEGVRAVNLSQETRLIFIPTATSNWPLDMCFLCAFFKAPVILGAFFLFLMCMAFIFYSWSSDGLIVWR